MFFKLIFIQMLLLIILNSIMFFNFYLFIYQVQLFQMSIKSVHEPWKWLYKIPQFMLVLQALKNVYYTEANMEKKLKFCVPKVYFKEGLKLVEQNKNNDATLMKNISRIRQNLNAELKSILYTSNN